MAKDMTIQEWHDQQFLPWKQAVAKVLDDRKALNSKLQANIGQLQAVLALVMDGKVRQALLAWNTLRLHPELQDIRLGQDGETLTLVTTGNEVKVLRVDELVADLERMLAERGME